MLPVKHSSVSSGMPKFSLRPLRPLRALWSFILSHNLLKVFLNEIIQIRRILNRLYKRLSLVSFFIKRRAIHGNSHRLKPIIDVKNSSCNC